MSRVDEDEFTITFEFESLGLGSESRSQGGSELIIAIDFGTTYTGVAYAHTSKFSNAHSIEDNVKVIKNWPNRSDSYAEKTPTIIAYNKNPLNWGGSVRKNDELQVAHFKIGLQEGARNFYSGGRSGIHSSTTVAALEFLDPEWKHPRMPQKTPQDFTADYLKCVLSYVRDEYLPSHYAFGFLRNQKVSYVITVPAIWTDSAKNLTRKAAVRAGIPNNNLELITEPEAAALYCATIGGEMDLQVRERFLVCDAGGGTVVCSLEEFDLIIGLNCLRSIISDTLFCEGV